MKNLLSILLTALLSITMIQSQESDQKRDDDEKSGNVYFEIKEVSENVKPDVYVDGKKFDFELDLLDQSKIESVDILKNEQAIEKYNAPNGVVLIKTKRDIKSNYSKIVLKKSKSKDKKKTPLIIINGKISSRKAIDKLSPNNIKEIKILKDKQAIEKYNAPNGVVIVITKNGN